jgi:hypothetical protein
LPGNRLRENTGKAPGIATALPPIAARQMCNCVIAVTPPVPLCNMVNPTDGVTVMSKLFVIAALAFALAAGTIIDAVTIAQAAHADCISKNC